MVIADLKRLERIKAPHKDNVTADIRREGRVFANIFVRHPREGNIPKQLKETFANHTNERANGNGSYSDMLPPHSYMDMRKFGSPRHLADYIRLQGASGAVSDHLEGGAHLHGLVPLQRMQPGSTPGRQACPERSRFGPVAEWNTAHNCFHSKQFHL